MTRSRVLLPVVLLLAALAPVRSAAAAEDPREVEARAQYARGDYQKALNVFAALFAERGNPLYLRNIGRCHQKLRQPDKAIDAFEEYLRRGRRLKPQEKTEIKGFIREMEALRAEQAKAPAVAAPPSVLQPPAVGPAPPPVAVEPSGRSAASSSSSAPARGSSASPGRGSPGAAASPGRGPSSASSPGRVAASARPVPSPLPALPATPAEPSGPLVTVTTKATPAPEPRPLTRQWWFWAGVGAVVVGGAVAAFALKGGGAGKPACPPEYQCP